MGCPYCPPATGAGGESPCLVGQGAWTPTPPLGSFHRRSGDESRTPPRGPATVVGPRGG